MNLNYFLKTVFIFFCLSLVNVSQAQKETEYIQGELIVQLEKYFTNVSSIVEKNVRYKNVETKLEAVELLSESMNIWFFRFDATVVNHTDFANHLGLNKNIIEFQNNHLIKKRSTPNDAEFSQQWQYVNSGGSGGIVGADLDADLAWELTTGGVTPSGDTIVVCIVDDGILNVHEDLEANLWVNRLEIPGNGIDDDNNGYIDDYEGFNANNNSAANLDDIYTNPGFFGVHGNAVAGVVGAKGNNSIGVAGINWDVKLMIVKNQGVSENQVIKAYEYPLKMRKLYNDTDGAKGAFVVSVNSSWGIDNGDPTDVPLWCAFYDEMGAAGIINAAATANANSNIDVVGDLPTACSSDYLFTVTNVWRDDQKVTDAGYGSTTIDIGAFGRDAHTVSEMGNSDYAGFGGTSGATPQVAGAIALLYSAPCTSFSDLYKTDPAAAALKAKEYIMDGSDANTSLQGITVSGGRLNLYGMFEEMNEESSCLFCPEIENIVINSTSETSVDISFDVVGNASLVDSYIIRYRDEFTTSWTTINSNTNSLSIASLDNYSTYEYQIQAVCSNGFNKFNSSNFFSIKTLSINKLAIENGIEVYPNPTKDILYIKLKELQKDFEIYFYDISGKLLYQGEMYTQKKKINISVLQSGIYILKLKDESGNVYTHMVNKM